MRRVKGRPKKYWREIIRKNMALYWRDIIRKNKALVHLTKYMTLDRSIWRSLMVEN